MAKAGVECFFRRIEYVDQESGQVLVFLTNHMILAAAVYKERWQIELFSRP